MSKFAKGNGALICVAHVYSPSQAGLKISALEGAGFDVFAPWYHTFCNLQYHGVALGGLPILVPRAQAEDALALLLENEIADEDARMAVPVPRHSPATLLGKILMAIVYWKTATGPALNVCFLPIDRRAAKQGDGAKENSSA